MPRGWSMTTRSRLDRTTRPRPTMPLPRMASRMTANASRATLFSGTSNTGYRRSARRSRIWARSNRCRSYESFRSRRVQLFVLDPDINALFDLVASPLVVGIDRIAGLFVDQLLTEAVAGFLIDLPEGDALGRGCRCVQGDRTRDERKLEVALPIGARRGHGNSYSTRTAFHYTSRAGSCRVPFVRPTRLISKRQVLRSPSARH